MISVIETAGADPAMIHACRRTETPVIEGNLDQPSGEDLTELQIPLEECQQLLHPNSQPGPTHLLSRRN